MHAKAQRVQEALADLGMALQVRELPDSTRTAAEAAAAVGTNVAQIAKSLVFLHDDRVVLVIASGANRVSTEKLAAFLGGGVIQPDAKTVKRLTGYSVGGVPPVGHLTPPVTFIDQDLLLYDTLWAAAGTPNAVFPLSPTQLIALTAGQVVDCKA